MRGAFGPAALTKSARWRWAVGCSGTFSAQHAGSQYGLESNRLYALPALVGIGPGHSKARRATLYKAQSSSNGMTKV